MLPRTIVAPGSHRPARASLGPGVARRAHGRWSAGSRTLPAVILLPLLLGSLSGGVAHEPTGIRTGLDPAVPRALRDDGEVSVVVRLREEASDGSREARRAAIRRCQARVLEKLPAGAYALRYRFRSSPVIVVNTRQADILRALDSDPDVVAIDFDQRGTGALDQSRAVIGAEEVFQDLAITGSGRVVAVLDTGIENGHPSLAGSVIHEKTFLFQGKLVLDTAVDGHGHGTHVSGIIASRGGAAPRGIAPGASIVAVKVLDDENNGWITDWAAGVQHVVELHEAPNGIRVDAINMSLVTTALHEDVCNSASLAMAGACRDALSNGIAVFAASGNQGSLTKMSLPACISSVFSVGSTGVIRVEPEFEIDYYRISDFTSRNHLLDLLAPGASIRSADLAGTTFVRSGTSQAVAHASACALLLREVDPTILPGTILELLTGTGHPIDDPLSPRSFPQVDALAALGTLIAPRFDEIRCTHDPISGIIVAFWRALEDADAIRVEVFEDGSLYGSETLPGEAGQYTVMETEPGRTYELIFRAEVSGAPGLPSSCTVVTPAAKKAWIRSDCNDDGKLDIADAIATLQHLFVGSVTVPCRAACDSNDDERVDITDAVYSLVALFRGGSLPPAPFPDCGEDPTPGSLPCGGSRCEG